MRTARATSGSARSKRRAARGQILAAPPAVLARAYHASGHVHAVAIDAAQLDRHDRVHAPRHDGAGHDAHAFAGSDDDRCRLAREDRSDGRERQVCIRLEDGAVEGVAVHRRVVVCRDVDG